MIQRQLASARTGRKPLRIALSAALLTGVVALTPISPFSASPASAADVWSAPLDLSGSSDVATLPQVSADSEGNAVAVWLKVTVLPDSTPTLLCDDVDKCVVQAAQFDPATEVWSAPVTLSSSAENATQADVLINGSGEAMAIWRRTSAGATVIQARLFDGANWSGTTTDLSVTTGSPRGPQISVSPAGVFTAVWYRSQNSTTNIIESRQFIAGAWTVSPLAVTLPANENAELSRVVSDSAGNVVALWQGQLVDLGPFYVRASRFTAGAWSAPVTLSAPATLGVGETLAPQLAIDGAGNATAAWHQSDGTNTTIRTSRYTAGGSWGAPQTLSAAAGNALNARVESDDAGNVTALWRRFDSGGFSVIQTARYSISTHSWGSVVDLSTTGRQSQAQRLAVDGAGNVTAVWRRNNSDSFSIVQSARFSKVTNTWGAARDLSANGGNAVSPSTDVDQNGNVVVIWSRNNIIQVSSSSNIPGFVPVAPVRVFDTRPGLSLDALRVVEKVKVGGTYELTVNMANLTGATPATGIGAVSLNVTVDGPDQDGFVTVYPCGVKPGSSNVNFVAGQTVANAVIAPVAADGRVCFFSNTPTHILADINGYFPTASGYTPVTPKRVFDTRPGLSADALLTVPKSKIGGTTELRVSMLGLSSGSTTPGANVSAVSLNVTVANPVAGGFVTVYPCGTRELVSSVNFVAGQTVANAVLAPLSTSGELCFFSNVNTDILVDINGWFPIESGYAPATTPARVFDTRGESPDALRVVPIAKIGGTSELRVRMTDLSDVTPPLGVGAVALNITVTNPIGPGFVTVYPCGVRPGVSSINFIGGQTVANAVIAPLSASGELCFFSNLATDLVVDINGFFAITVA